MTALPDRSSDGPLIAYYGDDFTGSTDAMAALHAEGVPTLLFLRTPDTSALKAARRYRAVGLAGISRSLSPAAMRRELPVAFNVLAALQPAVLHYKVCSTFDSAPTLGNIGVAIELGRAAVAARTATPIVVGAPALRRYTAFGHLYAAFGENCWRLDRHPTMSVHPATPMREADLLRHLAAQTRLRGALLDFVTLAQEDVAEHYDRASKRTEMLLIDVLDDASQLRAGRLLWRAAQQLREHRQAPLFCAGSSGVSAALVAAWRDADLLAANPASIPGAAATPAVAAVSGSCSPQTAAQISAAAANGYDCVRVDMTALLTPAGAQAERARVLSAMKAALARGRSALAYTASGPQDPAIARWRPLRSRLPGAGWEICSTPSGSKAASRGWLSLAAIHPAMWWANLALNH